MIILGLGSNLEDKLDHLRNALQCIKNLPSVRVAQVSPIYISEALLPDNAPDDWNTPYLNLAIRIETTLSPVELYHHVKHIEKRLGRYQQATRWAPRIIDIDLLVWNDISIDSDLLTIPHRGLLDRPFALWPLADIAPTCQFNGKTAAELVESFGSRFSGDAPFRTRMIAQRIDTPFLMGIINVTPDSFTDGNYYLEVDHAIKQAHHLMNTGADILDIGAESTSPTATPIDASTEWARLEPVLEALANERKEFVLPPKISIDTRHADVAQRALAYGIDYLNDVTGLDDPAMREFVREANIECIFMHHKSVPARRNDTLPRNENVIKTVYDWTATRLDELEREGFSRDKLIFDPGIGFGKAAEQSLALLQSASVFKNLGIKLLIGHSRKSFLSLLTPHPTSERDIETNVISHYLAKSGIDFLRVHNVDALARSLRVSAMLASL